MSTVCMPATPGLPFLGDYLVTSQDATTLAGSMHSHSVPHAVEVLRPHLNGQVTALRVGDVRLAWVRYGCSARVVADPTGELVCWTIPLGPMGVGVGLQSLGTTSHGFVLAADAPTSMYPDPTRGAVVLTTSRQRLEEHFQRFSRRLDAPQLRVRPGLVASPGVVDSAWRYVARVRRVAPHTAAMTELLEDTLLTALLVDVPSTVSHLMQEHDEAPAGADATAARAAQWAHDHCHEPIQMADWAAAVGISVRHLQKVFHDAYGCSPLRYLTVLRLQRAHERLRRPQAQDSVTSIAMASGFSHMGRFSAAYREAYAVAPSQTLAAAREQSRHLSAARRHP